MTVTVLLWDGDILSHRGAKHLERLGFCLSHRRVSQQAKATHPTPPMLITLHGHYTTLGSLRLRLGRTCHSVLGKKQFTVSHLQNELKAAFRQAVAKVPIGMIPLRLSL